MNYIEIVGWTGTFLIVLAYFLVSYRKIESRDTSYQLMNLFGAIGVGINVFHQGAWPAVALQTLWGVIAIFSLIRENIIHKMRA
jgi:hypothetical protein